MRIFDADITQEAALYLTSQLRSVNNCEAANQLLVKQLGIVSFFDSQEEFEILKSTISSDQVGDSEPDRAEYGDFQTNERLALEICNYLALQKIEPEIVVEPTCGKGSFIIAALKSFNGIKKIYGVEIYKPYLWQVKFNIIAYFIQSKRAKMPIIELRHLNVFDFDFKTIGQNHSRESVLIIGNPPWVTNSKLASLSSTNLPRKSNFKGVSGLDAITGKGNFDIGEYITLMMLDSFQQSVGHMAFLVKNSVIKNVMFDQHKNHYAISDIRKLTIDSKKEFNVLVEAALLCCKLNSEYELVCRESSFYGGSENSIQFGWINDRYVSNITKYEQSFEVDGTCPFVWRQGVKHDLSFIMEFEKLGDGVFINGNGEKTELEEDLVFGLLKSSDLKKSLIKETRKFTIVPQQKVGQETAYIAEKYPKTFKYLEKNKKYFLLRKSRIYQRKPDFSIFGIGDYSFKPHKVAISGLYKNYDFSLVLSQNEKPIMLDDTCYFIGFDNLSHAIITTVLLNSQIARSLLESITFTDAKRIFTKEILMRIDLQKLLALTPKEELIYKSNILAKSISGNLAIAMADIQDFLIAIESKVKSETQLSSLS